MAKLKAQREDQKQQEAARQVEKQVQTNGVLNGKGKTKMEEGARSNRKGKGKEKEVVVVVGEHMDGSKVKVKRATLAMNNRPTNKGKQKANVGVQIKSDETQPEPEVVGEPGNESNPNSNDILNAVDEVPGKGQEDLLSSEVFTANPSSTTGASYASLDPSTSSSSSSSSSINGPANANGQQTQTTPSSAVSVRRKSRRYLRVRDFNPYSLKLAGAEIQSQPLTVPHLNQNGTSNHLATGPSMCNGKGKHRALALSSSPPPRSYSYPYPIHLSVNLNLSHPNGISSTRYTPSTSPPHNSALSSSDSSAPTNSEDTNKVNIWGKRRVVREPSITPVKGVFKKDIVSWLPYTEVVSEETFEVTDVMMDDCRLLLLKVCFDISHLFLLSSTNPVGPLEPLSSW